MKTSPPLLDAGSDAAYWALVGLVGVAGCLVIAAINLLARASY